ncbi:MAG: hypothetical protein JRF04_00495 [Deltaproteobacteria bacterium]|nr:hypothetical protein [Deltaproteobacteria bacterium]
MAKIHNIDQKQKADRQTALLALAATSKDTEQTDCLTADEMACLVDNQCSPDDQEQFYLHLTHCEICYHQWVELSELASTDTIKKSRKGIHTLFQPRNLAWAGSALAAAASIVLFLNITGETPSPVLHKPLQTGVERSWVPAPGMPNDVEQAESRAKITEQNIDTMHDTVQSEMETQASTPSSVSVKEKITQKEMLTKKQKLNFTVLKEEAQVMGTSVGKAVDGLPRKSIYQGQVQAGEWIERIQQGCLSQKENILFWEKQYQEGKELIRFDSTEEKKLVNDLLPLIEQLQQSSDKNSFICKRILLRLETNTGR